LPIEVVFEQCTMK